MIEVISKKYLLIKRFLAQQIVFYGSLGALNGQGRGDKELCDKFAVEHIREFLNKQDFAKIFTKTGEGEMDNSAMIHINEILGNGALEFDMAIDPLDCTTACSKGAEDSISAVCIANKGEILNCPDIYMEKLASCNLPKNLISLNNSFEENIKIVAEFKKKKVEDVSVIMLDRERHQKFIDIARKNNIKLNLVKDGDIMAILKTHFEDIDFYYGTGGSPEGIISASATIGFDGFFEGKFIYSSEEEKNRAISMGVILNKIYSAEEFVGKSSVFAICAIGNNPYLKGIKILSNNNKNKVYAEIILIDSALKSLEKTSIEKIL